MLDIPPLRKRQGALYPTPLPLWERGRGRGGFLQCDHNRLEYAIQIAHYFVVPEPDYLETVGM